MGNALFNRCCCVRVRPDVLCGAVMDAVSTALVESGCTIEVRVSKIEIIAKVLPKAVPTRLCARHLKSSQVHTNHANFVRRRRGRGGT